jgi:hypothetical protein
MEDSDSLQKLKEGNKLAFNQLLALYREKCRYFLLNQDDARTQKVFIEILPIKSFRGDTKFST